MLIYKNAAGGNVCSCPLSLFSELAAMGAMRPNGMD